MLTMIQRCCFLFFVVVNIIHLRRFELSVDVYSGYSVCVYDFVNIISGT